MDEFLLIDGRLSGISDSHGIYMVASRLATHG